MIEKKRKDGGKLYLGFLDIEKPYDRVNREMLGKILGKIGLSANITNIVHSMYVDTRAKYRLGDRNGLGEEQRGVRQGLSPTLFSLYTEELAARMRRLNAGVRVGNDRIGVLLYADDVVVMSESVGELESLLDVVDGNGKDFGVDDCE